MSNAIGQQELEKFNKTMDYTTGKEVGDELLAPAIQKAIAEFNNKHVEKQPGIEV